MKTRIFRLRLLLLAGAICLAALAVVTEGSRSFRAQPGRAAAAQAEPQSLLSTADAVFNDMSEITTLPIKAPLKKQVLNRAQIRDYLTQDLKEEYTPREVRQEEAMLKAFGLVSRDFDLEKFLITFFTEQAAGVYDARRKTMLIADWVAPEMQKLVLSHELTHALQDQNFDLEKFEHGDRSDNDSTNARHAVVEGYATAAMMQELIKPAALANLPSFGPLLNLMTQRPMTEFPAFSSAPFFFRFVTLFPYSEGTTFMQAGLTHGGWKRLNRLFSEPPGTTKEIFEPELYFKPDFGPVEVTIVGGAGTKTNAPPRITLSKLTLPHPETLSAVPGLGLLDENTLGELGYYSLLGQLISEEEAKKLAPAWLADRYLLYENPPAHQYALVARSRWTSPETALAFFRDYHTILARKFAELRPDSRSGEDLFVGTAASGAVILLRQGEECRWAEGVPAAQAAPTINWLRSL